MCQYYLAQGKRSKMVLKQRIKKITQTHGSDIAVLCKDENVSDLTLFVDLGLLDHVLTQRLCT